MTIEEMRRVHQAHVAAENRQDVEAAIAVCHPDCFVENVPLKQLFRGRSQVGLRYAALFAAFPDLEMRPEGEAFGADVLVAWGTVHGTMRGSFLGQAPTGRSLALPFVNVVPFRDGLMLGEKVYFDLATLCEQVGLPLDAVRASAAAGPGPRGVA